MVIVQEFLQQVNEESKKQERMRKLADVQKLFVDVRVIVLRCNCRSKILLILGGLLFVRNVLPCWMAMALGNQLKCFFSMILLFFRGRISGGNDIM